MEKTEKILRKAYRAFNAREIEGALKLMAPDVEWPNGMEDGEEGHITKMEIREA